MTARAEMHLSEQHINSYLGPTAGYALIKEKHKGKKGEKNIFPFPKGKKDFFFTFTPRKNTQV